MKIRKLLIIILVLIILDQLIKSYFVGIRGTSVSPIEVYKNTGISFSLLPNLPWRSVLPFVLFFLIGVLLKRQSYGLSLVIAGGLSNLLDRFWRGGVVDFIDISIFPVFNVADLLISVGSLTLLIEIIKFELKDKTQIN